jgi:tetratricopeptide (TPR) repeat protein
VFTDEAPTNAPFKIGLRSFEIDLPPGNTNVVVEHSYVVPVDVDVLSVLPHAHYLGKDLQGYATLPDGTRRWLMRIENWDFNWQGEYHYARPVELPKGSRLTMRFAYDNSTNNTRNPHHPPRRVQYGVETTDEMGELWFQVLPRNREDRAVLAEDYRPLEFEEIVAFNRHRLRLNPNDGRAHCQLGQVLLATGKDSEALEHLTAAAAHEPEYDEPHYFMGIMHRSKGQDLEARKAFEETLRLNPAHYKAHGNLGLMAMQYGDFPLAENHLKAALIYNSKDSLAMDALGVVYVNQGQLDLAEKQFRAALRLEPDNATFKNHVDYVAQLKAEAR